MFELRPSKSQSRGTWEVKNKTSFTSQLLCYNCLVKVILMYDMHLRAVTCIYQIEINTSVFSQLFLIFTKG